MWRGVSSDHELQSLRGASVMRPSTASSGSYRARKARNATQAAFRSSRIGLTGMDGDPSALAAVAHPSSLTRSAIATPVRDNTGLQITTSVCKSLAAPTRTTLCPARISTKDGYVKIRSKTNGIPRRLALELGCV